MTRLREEADYVDANLHPTVDTVPLMRDAASFLNDIANMFLELRLSDEHYCWCEAWATSPPHSPVCQRVRLLMFGYVEPGS
jgi:hypothetical protein